jgi:threonine/homoserine/homoserine lactone efflux protein
VVKETLISGKMFSGINHVNFIDSISLFLIMVTLAAIPNASVALVVARSATLGISNGIAVATGIVLGDLVFVVLAILGLSVVAETMGALFAVFKYLGGAYLIWFGFSLLKPGRKATFVVEEEKLNGNILTSLFSGLLLTLGDVKAIIFYASLLPAFINLAAIEITDSIIIIFITLIAVGTVKVFYAVLADKVVKVAGLLM